MLRSDTVELRWFLSVIRRWLWLILGITLLFAAGAFLISSRMTPVYSASTTLLVQQSRDNGSSDYSAILASERLAHTYAQMLKSRPVLEAVIEQLGFEEEPGDLAKRVGVDLIRDTQLIRLSVEDRDPGQAAEIANTIAEAFIAQNRARQSERYNASLASIQAQMEELSAQIEGAQTGIDALATPETAEAQAESARLQGLLAGYRNTYASVLQSYEQMRLDAAQSADTATVVEMAQVPESPIQRRRLYTTVAGAVGGMLAVGVAFLMEYLDDTLKTPEEVQRSLGLEALGVIGCLKEREEELVVATDPHSSVAEAFRVLSTNVRFSKVIRPLRTLLVTSPGYGEGKSIIAANLAVAMSQAGLQVIVLDADLRRPRLHRLFGFNPYRKGLSRVLLNQSIDGTIELAHVEGLQFLPAGPRPPNLAEMVESLGMQRLLEKLAQRVDVVVIDSPPVLPVADAAVLAQRVDGVLLVVKATHTRREEARQAVQRLENVGAILVGVALNATSTSKDSYHDGHISKNGEDEGWENWQVKEKENLSTLRRLFGVM